MSMHTNKSLRLLTIAKGVICRISHYRSSPTLKEIIRVGVGIYLLRSRQGESSLRTRPVNAIRPSAFDGVAV